MTFDVRQCDLRALNSATKYPSIPTYHKLDPKNGGLLEECISFPDRVIATEKVDGTNSRIILCPDGTWLLGSREELLYASGDLIGNPALGIVDALKPVAENLTYFEDDIRVFFLELFGGKIGGAARQYVKDPTSFGWRLFDVAIVPVDALSMPSVSAWRDGGGQRWLDEDDLYEVCDLTGLDWTPRLADGAYADGLPITIDGVATLLADLAPHTRCRLDDGQGKAEGVVFRSPDRSVIAKARFQDYERTLRRRK